MFWPLGLFLRFFFFNDTATTEIYTLSLHDALPIFFLYDRFQFPSHHICRKTRAKQAAIHGSQLRAGFSTDRKSTRLNSSHVRISYAVFCLKKKISSGTSDWSTARMSTLYAYTTCGI